MKIAVTLGIVLLFAQAPFQRPVTLGELRQQGVPEPPEVLLAERSWAGADVLMPLVTSGNPQIQRFAIKAVGRLEDPRAVPQLLALANAPEAPVSEIAAAIAQSLKGFDPARDPEMIAKVSAWLRRISFIKIGNTTIVRPTPIGSIAYAHPDEVHGAEDVLRWILDDSSYSREKVGAYVATARSLESLGRLNARLTTFDEETVTWLVRIVVRTRPNDEIDAAREGALAALISARALDADTERQALRDTAPEVRRLAMTVLTGAGAGLADEERLDLIEHGFSDTSGQVRYEALRGYIRRGARTRGCGPILNLLSDPDMHVLLAAIDSLGDLCKDDESVTERVVAEARLPQVINWHKETHAFVALAKRAPDRSALAMEAFVTHPSPWVRMYAARAAAAAEDLIRLDKLAYDANDNVREAALGPLRRLKKEGADAAVVAALDRSDVQLLRTAATLIKDFTRNERLARPLITALQRLTKEGKETSRDARLPLLEAIAIHATPDDALQLQPMLKDFDPKVAAKAADVVTQLTGKAAVADPKPPQRGWPPAFRDLRDQCVTVSLSSGPSFRMRMDPAAAPMTVDRFLQLAAIDHYYDGLTIHRIAPNFVIQGGGPGANEYSGHKEYMRDEIGARNARGTVGLSTRGRNTADAQFFINLVNNPRLDGDYTVFASVMPADMPVVDRIQEGDAMRMSLAKCTLK